MVRSQCCVSWPVHSFTKHRPWLCNWSHAPWKLSIYQLLVQNRSSPSLVPRREASQVLQQRGVEGRVKTGRSRFDYSRNTWKAWHKLNSKGIYQLSEIEEGRIMSDIITSHIFSHKYIPPSWKAAFVCMYKQKFWCSYFMRYGVWTSL